MRGEDISLISRKFVGNIDLEEAKLCTRMNFRLICRPMFD